MEISIPLNSEELIILDHNIIDETRIYTPGNGTTSSVEPYSHEEELLDGDILWEYVALDGIGFTPPTWTQVDENAGEYAIGDVLYKDNYNVKLESIGAHDVAKQPEAYLYDTSWLYDTWTKRYTRLLTGLSGTFNGFSDQLIGGSKHSLYRTTSYTTGWGYRVSWQTTSYVWSDPALYSTSSGSESMVRYILTTATGAQRIDVYWKGNRVYSNTNASLPDIGTVFNGTDGFQYKNVELKARDVAETGDDTTTYYWGNEVFNLSVAPLYYCLVTVTDYGNIFQVAYWNGVSLLAEAINIGTSSQGYIFTSGGRRYRIGTLGYSGYPNYYYAIQREESTTVPGETEPYDTRWYSISKNEVILDTVNKYASATVTTESSLDVYENKAYAFESPIREKWIGKHFIVRGSELYLRTNLDIAQDSVGVTDYNYGVIQTLDEFPNFVQIGVINYLKPFDGKKYTTVSQSTTDENPVRYLIQSPVGQFDTIAMAGIIAGDIEVTFISPDGSTELAKIESYVPRNDRDIDKTLDPYPTTVILYSTADNAMPAGSHVEIIFKGGIINIGSIALGLGVNAGFTNLEFSTKFKDWSPKEVDQWGNVTYITNDKSGNTVDVKTLTWNGTVDIPITNFDMITRLMTSLGASTVIINGSDAKDNQPPNNEDIFASTMLIGRLKDFNLKTKIKNKKMNEYATYSVVVEEDI